MNKYTFIGDGRNKDFYFTFPFFSKSDIIVEINGNIATGYSVFLIPGNGNNDFPFTGGHIHFATAPKSTDVVTIERKLQYNRLIDYQPTVALNPTTVNQDMNYFFELLKDIKSDLNVFAETYADFTDTESAQTLLTQINAVMDEIDNLGDISVINTNITNLGTSITNLTNSLNTLTTTVGAHTTNIGTLDSRTSGVIDYVVASQEPTAENNYTWYRKYKSGWVEQGGEITGISNAQTYWNTITIQLPLEMSDTHYCVIATDAGIGSAGTTGTVIDNCTTTSFKWNYFNGASTAHCNWYVKGILKTSE